jgi:hypothetical protein
MSFEKISEVHFMLHVKYGSYWNDRLKLKKLHRFQCRLPSTKFKLNPFVSYGDEMYRYAYRCNKNNAR